MLELSGAQAFGANEVQQVALARTLIPLRYPREMLSIRMTGEVVVQYVVEPTGNVRPGSVTVIRSNHPSFTRAVMDALRTMKFEPARVGGLPVAQLVEQPFTFSIPHAGVPEQ